MQAGNLHDYTVMCQTVYEGVGNPFCDRTPLIVQCLMLHINNRFLDIAHLVPQKIDGHQGQGVAVMTFANNILGILVVHAQILPETQGLRLQPSLLKLYQNQMLGAILLANRSSKINTKHGERVTLRI